MELQDAVLNVTLHFTPITYIICATILLLRRQYGDKARILLAVYLLFWGGSMLGSLFFHYNDQQGVPLQMFSMISINISLFLFFIMLLYPLEVIKPGSVNLKNLLLLFSESIIVNIIILIARPEFRQINSFGEIFKNITEFNVWFRLISLASFIPMGFFVYYIPYKHTQSQVDLKWIRIYCSGILICVSIYIVWIITGIDMARIIIQIYCMVYCVIITYQELYLRFYIPPTHTSKLISISESLPENKNADVNNIQSKLMEAMLDNSVWSNPDLTLVMLASIIGTNRTTLSNTIRDMGHDNFHAFLNQYRIREFVKIIETNDIESIQAVFYDVGFRSRTTAIKYFRNEMGTTPSEYLQKTLLDKNVNI